MLKTTTGHNTENTFYENVIKNGERLCVVSSIFYHKNDKYHFNGSHKESGRFLKCFFIKNVRLYQEFLTGIICKNDVVDTKLIGKTIKISIKNHFVDHYTRLHCVQDKQLDIYSPLNISNNITDYTKFAFYLLSKNIKEIYLDDKYIVDGREFAEELSGAKNYFPSKITRIVISNKGFIQFKLLCLTNIDGVGYGGANPLVWDDSYNFSTLDKDLRYKIYKSFGFNPDNYVINLKDEWKLLEYYNYINPKFNVPCELRHFAQFYSDHFDINSIDLVESLIQYNTYKSLSNFQKLHGLEIYSVDCEKWKIISKLIWDKILNVLSDTNVNEYYSKSPSNLKPLVKKRYKNGFMLSEIKIK